MEEKKTPEPTASETWYRAFVWIGIVGGVFSLIVCALLLANYLQLKTSDPLDSKELAALRLRLVQEQQNEVLKEQIRSLDLELRREYFRRRRFSRVGSFLLIGGIAVFLIGVKSAASYREKLPAPRARSASDEESRIAALSRWSVSVFGLAVGVTALALIIIGSRIPYQASVTREPVSRTRYPTPEEIMGNWPRFRGPGGLGISTYTNVPSSWDGSIGEGILWKTPIPLQGESSPIVWGDRIFLTGATEERREIYCFDANSGELLWQRAVENIPFSPVEPPDVSEDTGFAAPTPVTDGQRVYAIFANGDLICLDFRGDQVWARNMGPFDNIYGHASSLAMYQDLLLVLLDQGGAEDGISELVAMEADTGRTVWQTSRPVPNSWASPIIIDTDGRKEIITCGSPWVISYDPATGQELWRVDCLGGDVAPSPVYGGGLVFVTNAYEVLAAIRPGGQGNVTETNIVWIAEDGLPDICSPLTNGELVFVLETYGLLTCYDAKDGTKVWEEDTLEVFKASPSLAGDSVYLLTEEGLMIIIKAGRTYEEIGRCELGEASNACPTFMDGLIYIRGKENLYCISGIQAYASSQ